MSTKIMGCLATRQGDSIVPELAAFLLTRRDSASSNKARIVTACARSNAEPKTHWDRTPESQQHACDAVPKHASGWRGQRPSAKSEPIYCEASSRNVPNFGPNLRRLCLGAVRTGSGTVADVLSVITGTIAMWIHSSGSPRLQEKIGSPFLAGPTDLPETNLPT